MLYYKNVSYLFLISIIISSCHLLGNPNYQANWRDISTKDIETNISTFGKKIKELKEALEKKTAKLVSEIEVLEREKKALVRDNSEINSLKKEIHTLKEENSTKEALIKSLEIYLESVKDAKAKLELNKDEKDSLIRKLKREVTSNNETIAKLENENNTNKALIAALKLYVKNLSNLIHSLGLLSDDKDEAIAKLNKEIEDKNTEISNLKQDKTNKNTEIIKLRKDIKELEDKYNKLEERDKKILIYLELTIDELEKEKTSLEVKITNLELELNTIKGAKEALDEDLKTKNDKIDKLEEDIKELKKEKKQLEQDKAGQKTKITDLEKKIADKQSEKEKLEKDKDIEISGLKTKLGKLERDLNSLKEQLRKNDGFDNFKNIVEKREREDSYTYKDFKKFKGELKNLSIWRKLLITDYNKAVEWREKILSNIIFFKFMITNRNFYESSFDDKRINKINDTIEQIIDNFNRMKELNRKDNVTIEDFLKKYIGGYDDRHSQEIIDLFYYYSKRIINAKNEGVNLSEYENKLTILELKEKIAQFTKILIYHIPLLYEDLAFLFEDTDKYFD